MPLQWRNQFWQSLEEGVGKRCSERATSTSSRSEGGGGGLRGMDGRRGAGGGGWRGGGGGGRGSDLRVWRERESVTYSHVLTE